MTKYRGKIKNYKGLAFFSWAYGNLVQENESGKAYIVDAARIRTDTKFLDIAIEVDPDTVGQYLGCNDSSGCEVFEGDIFEFDDVIWTTYHTSCGNEYDSTNEKNRAVVGFNDDTGRFDFTEYLKMDSQINADINENAAIDFPEFISRIEIMGNIFDNPELMEEN